jgi:hypothetical protein
LLTDLLGALGIEHLAALERLLDGPLQLLQRVLVPLAEPHVGIVEAAFEKEVGQRLQQVLGAEAVKGVLDVFGVFNKFHGRLRDWP